MNRRQRKKLRRGEFRELGFELRFALASGTSDADQDAFWTAFIDEIERIGLSFGGGGGIRWEGFLTARGARGSVEAAARDALAAWLAARPDVRDISAGPLVDAWVPAIS